MCWSRLWSGRKVMFDSQLRHWVPYTKSSRTSVIVPLKSSGATFLFLIFQHICFFATFWPLRGLRMRVKTEWTSWLPFWPPWCRRRPPWTSRATSLASATACIYPDNTDERILSPRPERRVICQTKQFQNFGWKLLHISRQDDFCKHVIDSRIGFILLNVKIIHTYFAN